MTTSKIHVLTLSNDKSEAKKFMSDVSVWAAIFFVIMGVLCLWFVYLKVALTALVAADNEYMDDMYFEAESRVASSNADERKNH